MNTIRTALFLFALAAGTASAADYSPSAGGGACVPTVGPVTWDFLVKPDTITQLHGIGLADHVRTVIMSDYASLPALLSVRFDDEDIPAVATGLARATCVCIRWGDDHSETIKREVEGTDFETVYVDALAACLAPAIVHRGSSGGSGEYNVSPSKVVHAGVRP